jgi:hypothetical protein
MPFALRHGGCPKPGDVMQTRFEPFADHLPFPERRRGLRVPAPDLHVELLSPAAFRVQGVEDISLGGFAVICDQPVLRGTVAEFRFFTGSGRIIEARATAKNTRPHDDARRFISGWAFDQPRE